MIKITAAITAVGKYVPEYVLTNKELETMVDTNDEWITTRTGIKERRVLKEEGLGTSYMAIKAAEDLLQKSNTNPAEIDLVIVATATPDLPVASTAAYVASEIGSINASPFRESSTQYRSTKSPRLTPDAKSAERTFSGTALVTMDSVELLTSEVDMTSPTCICRVATKPTI